MTTTPPADQPTTFPTDPDPRVLRQLEHVHVAGRCVKRRAGDPCPPPLLLEPGEGVPSGTPAGTRVYRRELPDETTHLCPPEGSGLSGETGGPTAEHVCCACFTHNDLPCCNAGHDAIRDALAEALRGVSPASVALSRILADAAFRWLAARVGDQAAALAAARDVVRSGARPTTHSATAMVNADALDRLRAALRPDPNPEATS